MMKKDEIYKGFRVLDVVDVPDCNSKGIYIVHERTGMELFHLLNEDEENLFSFSFRTVSLNSTGAAHVLEHSVLCGSEKYPLKDPFINMVNQSVNTFLNAFTYGDRTTYPAATTVKADYFNLMSVYADAVFFPLLKPEIFMQECHRLELDEKGKPCIQGVVYNEMKGSYSDINSVAYGEIEKALFKDTSYEYDSGGDPLEIPDLTHSQLKAFHKKYYSPANCLVFLYGNIPTEEQLSFIDENVLSKFKNGGSSVKWEKFPKDHEINHYVKAYGPADENSDSKSVVNMAWTTGFGKENRGELCIENIFLSNLLWGSDSAPVSKALIESNLGVDLSPQSGASLDYLFPFLICGLRGVDAANAKKVEKIINNTLIDICENGIPEEDLKRTCLAFEFNNKEVRRSNGPYSLVYMDRCLRGWQYGEKPWVTLQFASYFDVLKKRLETEKDYLSKLIHKYFLDNKEQVLVTITPSASWTKKRTASEKLIVKEQFAKTSKEEITKDLEKMYAFQKKEVTEEENNLLPRIKLSDLSASFEKITTKVQDFNGSTLIVSKQPTNGITYFDVCFPTDVLPAKEYPWLIPLCGVVSEMGWGDLNWEQASKLVLSQTGGMFAHFQNSTVPEESLHLMKEKNYVGRDWLVFSSKVLEDNIETALNILADCISNTNFKDQKRLTDVLNSMCNSISSNIVPYGHGFALTRSSCTENRCKAINEITNGISSYLYLKEFCSMEPAKVLNHLKNLFARIKKSGAVIHVTATEKGIKDFKKYLPQFMESINLGPLAEPYENKEDDFIKLTSIKGEKGQGNPKKEGYIDELIEIPGTVGFDGMSFQGSKFNTKESEADTVYTHCLSNTELWNTIRMAGGAYGVGLSSNSDNALSRFYTYRDPKPYESFMTLKECISNSAEKKYTRDEVEKAITGCYSDEIFPKTPYSAGLIGLMYELFGLNYTFKQRRIKWLLKLTPKDLEEAAKRHQENLAVNRKVILCGKELISPKILENSGKIIKLPL